MMSRTNETAEASNGSQQEDRSACNFTAKLLSRQLLYENPTAVIQKLVGLSSVLKDLIRSPYLFACNIFSPTWSIVIKWRRHGVLFETVKVENVAHFMGNTTSTLYFPSVVISFPCHPLSGLGMRLVSGMELCL